MRLFWIKFASKRGNYAFGIVDLPHDGDRQALNMAQRRGGAVAFGEKLAELSPIWSFATKNPVKAPTGWAEFAPSGDAFISEEMWKILRGFSPGLNWRQAPSLTGADSDQKWGWATGFPSIDVLNREKSAISPSGGLCHPILASLPNDLPDVFQPAGTYAIFVSEKAKKAMAASRLNGFSFEEVGV